MLNMFCITSEWYWITDNKIHLFDTKRWKEWKYCFHWCSWNETSRFYLISSVELNSVFWLESVIHQ